MDIDRVAVFSDRGWIVVLLLGIIAGVIAFVVAWGILKAAEKPAPTLLVMSLSMLTLLSIVAFVVTGSQEMATLSGVGLGALAAAVATMFGRIPEIRDDPSAPPVVYEEPMVEPVIEEEHLYAAPEEKDEGA